MWQKVTMLAVLCVVFIAFLLSPCHGYSAGAGDAACGSMVPGHTGTSPSTSPSPFEVIVSKDTYNPGETLQVTVRQKSGATDLFQGFLLQARRADPTLDQNSRIGTFTAVADTQIKCPDTLGNAITHTSASGKSSLTVDWTAPGSNEGHLEFRATFVKEYTIYWIEEKSAVVSDPTTAIVPTAAAGPGPNSDKKSYMDTNKLFDTDGIIDFLDDKKEHPLLRVIRQAATAAPVPGLDLSGCGVTKGCFRTPAGCVASSCETVVTWKDMNTYVHFELSGATIGWVAVGFSEDKYMGHDSVIECVFKQNPTTLVVQNSYNDGKSNDIITKSGISNDDGSANDDQGIKRLTCYFDRQKNINKKNLLTYNNDKVFDLSNSYYMLMTMGDAQSDGRKLMHSMDKNKEPKVSPYMVDLTQNLDITGTARYPLVKAHGCLMVIAWVMSAGLAIIMARYYKPMWPNNRICGERVWFAVHRFCMILTLFCTVAGFIIIFVQVGGYSSMSTLPNKAHPILGIIVTILVVVNPLLALCRCHPKHKYRPVFNWIHWFIGTIAFVLQSPTVFIGLGLPKAFVPGWLTWVMVAFLLFHIVVELMLEIHGCINSKKQKERSEEWEMRKKNDPTHETSEKEPNPVGTRFKTIMIALYIIVMLILGLIIVITIAVS